MSDNCLRRSLCQRPLRGEAIQQAKPGEEKQVLHISSLGEIPAHLRLIQHVSDELSMSVVQNRQTLITQATQKGGSATIST